MLDWNLAVAGMAALAALCALTCVIALVAHGKKCRQHREAAEAGIYHVQKTSETRAEEIRTELKSEIRQAIESLEAGLRGPELALSDRRISRANRAEALRLMRSGVAPETAAATLDMPKSDALLLARVANAIAVP